MSDFVWPEAVSIVFFLVAELLLHKMFPNNRKNISSLEHGYSEDTVYTLI
jgi:hypothetical protein